ncbi:MAG: hypothetical protein RIQ46_1125 [Pseudomonadota bacterium]
MALPPTNPDNGPANPGDRAAAQQDVFLREVDDALREDQLLTFLQRYGKPIAGLIVAGLLALAGYLWWDHHNKQVAGEAGEKLTIALDRVESGRLDAGDKELKSLADSPDGTAAAARLMRAGIALEQGRPAEATRLLAEVSADENAPQPFRDLATIREVAVNFDTMKPDVVVSRLKPLATPGNAWFGPAGELLAIAYLKQGNEKLAGPLFAAIARDKATPETLRRRARQMAGLLGVDAIDDPEKVLQETAAE